jgi:hypothetical protein
MTWWEWALVVLAGWLTLTVSVGIILGLYARHRGDSGAGDAALIRPAADIRGDGGAPRWRP